MENSLPDECAASLGFPAFAPVASLFSITHLFDSGRKRCGVYLLHFQAGSFYIGQSVDVVRRFSEHRRIYDDIVGFSFLPVEKIYLEDKEKDIIFRAEIQGIKIINAVHVSILSGTADLDSIIPRAEQDEWLKDPISFVKQRPQGEKITLPDSLQIRFAKSFQKFRKHQLAPKILPLAKRYIEYCLPFPRKTEHSFWAVSCMPSTNRNTFPRLLSVNVGVMEIFVAGWMKHNPTRLWAFLTIAGDVLEDSGISIYQLKKTYPFLNKSYRGYRDAGQYQVTLSVEGDDKLEILLDNPTVLKAAATLALRVMRKHATIYSKFHCSQLADVLLAEEGAKNL
ncbi:GIY-YIG nuclease family protein [Chitinimonas lacunae]|uniref:GIY-YIG nuclease family protein n=1 Tax=Chitinimonas lacunae TaxID=1963018 RepID=A0ABV8MTE3_9NEIS